MSELQRLAKIARQRMSTINTKRRKDRQGGWSEANRAVGAAFAEIQRTANPDPALQASIQSWIHQLNSPISPRPQTRKPAGHIALASTTTHREIDEKLNAHRKLIDALVADGKSRPTNGRKRTAELGRRRETIRAGLRTLQILTGQMPAVERQAAQDAISRQFGRLAPEVHPKPVVRTGGSGAEHVSVPTVSGGLPTLGHHW